jgi:uncharacterized protein (DUF433 family)
LSSINLAARVVGAVLNAASRSLGNPGGEHTARAMVDAIARAGDRNRAHIQNLGIYSVNNGDEDEQRFFSSFERTADGCTMIRRRVPFMSALDWSQCPLVESMPGKVSGAWVFRGPRMPVAAVFESLEAEASIEDITEWFNLTRERVTAVLEP